MICFAKLHAGSQGGVLRKARVKARGCQFRGDCKSRAEMVVAQVKLGSYGDREKGSDLGYICKVIFFKTCCQVRFRYERETRMAPRFLA